MTLADSQAPKPPPRVFVNCPFDAQFEPLRDAIILSCVGCGFLPTSAIVKGAGGKLRIDRIFAELESSRYSIHDLSRSGGEGEFNLARFNMPLELGMAMFLARIHESKHDWLALVPSGPSYARYISDLAGFDPDVYDGTLPQIIGHVVAFLAVQDDAARGVNPRKVAQALPVFESKKRELQHAWVGHPVPWPDLVEAARHSFSPETS